MDGGAWWAAVHGVARSQTRLSDFTLFFHFHALENPSDGRAWWAAVYALTAFLRPPKVPRHAGFPRGDAEDLGWEDPLEKEMATHSSILAWRIPWTEEPGRLQSMESLGVRHD